MGENRSHVNYKMRYVKVLITGKVLIEITVIWLNHLNIKLLYELFKSIYLSVLSVAIVLNNEL